MIRNSSGRRPFHRPRVGTAWKFSDALMNPVGRLMLRFRREENLSSGVDGEFIPAHSA